MDEKYLRRLQREKNARKEAEKLLEEKSLELYNLNCDLEKKVVERTNELHLLNENLEERIEEATRKNKIQEQKMFEQARMAQMGELISMIAHQWRQPLTSISGRTSDILFSLELGEYDFNTQEGIENHTKDLTKKLETINEIVQNLSMIINDFKDFYKPNKPKSQSNFENVLSRSLDIIGRSLEKNGIEVNTNIGEQKELMMHDNELMQVVLNILNNAKENFNDKKIDQRVVEIEIQNKSLSICDNGGGIPTEVLPKIFDPYFSTKHEKNGTGLGLYMSKIIVEDHHNGSIICENLNDGCCFTITI